MESKKSLEWERKHKIYTVGLIFLLLWGFWLLWEPSARHLQVQNEFNFESIEDIEHIDVESKIIFENYLPFSQMLILKFRHYSWDAFNQTSSYENEIWIDEGPDLYDINISKIQWQVFYGDEPLKQPLTFTGDHIQSLFDISPLSKSIITVCWNYSTNMSDLSEIETVRLFAKEYETSDKYGGMEGSSDNPIIQGRDFLKKISRSWLFGIFLPIIIILWTGFYFAKILNIYKNLNVMADGLKELSELNLANLKSDIPNPINKTFHDLAFKPNLIGYIFSIIFALAIILFKISCRNWISRLLLQAKNCDESIFKINKENKKTVMDQKNLKSERMLLEAYLKEPATSPAEKLVQAKSIGLILAFLASVGVAFSFNAGAIAPFIYALGVTFLFLNLGFLYFLVRKSRFDKNRVILFIGLGWFIIAIPKIIIEIRVFL